MKNETESASPKSPARGLATLALLKTNFDQGKDHIEMFMPFVLDAIALLPSGDFSGEDIAKAIRVRHGLVIPAHTLGTLLRRVSKKHPLRRTGGRYFRDSAFATSSDISEKRRQLVKEHGDVAASLIEFAEGSGFKNLSEDDALSLVFQFLANNHVSMILEESTGAPFVEVEESGLKPLGRKESRMVARFVLDRSRTNPHIAACLQNMLEGFMLQNALFLRDIGNAPRRFASLIVFLDSALLLEALGLEGETAAIATRETLDLLRDTGAHLGVFDKTLAEVKSILGSVERHLGTSDGIAKMRHSDLTRYVLTHRKAPSDIRESIALLEQDVRALGITIRSTPTRDPRYTLNETTLTQLVRKPQEDETHPRVTHDVDAIAAVLTLRRGHTTQSLDDAGAVFATRTGLLVKNAREWYKAEQQEGIPPVVHRSALSSAAWLKRPASAASLRLHELVALCAAAVRPSERVWERFVSHLRKLRDANRINSDEMVAIVASELSDLLLSEIDDEGDPDAETIEEIVRRVRTDDQTAAEARLTETKTEYEEKLGAARAVASQAEAERATEVERRRKLELRIRYKAHQRGKILSWVVVGPTMVLAVAGSTALVTGLLPADKWTWHLIGLGVESLAWIVASIMAISGGHLSEWRERLARVLEKRFRMKFGLEEK